ncbi:RNA-directed DNA polymerase [Maribacter caenipelagi]|uniref:RNA-directed DNA polymerase n=1 Tax=Maribacter caenipelagi TaxID=1447781 RepID=A0A4R7D1U9_9FLAO|nr:reverse transcriptase family protein [Maribacter caenipelagi]TDS14232.1 RNA-directed DNA polymerase [Maribacter caenipelagi]
MSFEVYAKKFRVNAENLGYSEENVVKCINYARPIYENGLPIIYNLTHLSKLVGFEKNYIIQAAVVSKHSEAYYRYHKVLKKNGDFRKIKEPLPNLKAIQHWILANILEEIEPSVYAKAYVKKRGLKQNIRFHKAQKKVFTIDIKNFFPSININQIEKIFIETGYSIELSNYLAKLCCLKNTLPQGAPTSPYISNLILKDIDNSIAIFCKELKVRYTRYADDLTFSGDFEEESLYEFVNALLEKNGFELNKEKTRLMLSSQRQIVTGIIVNSKPQLDKETRKLIRQEIYYIKKFGLESHMERAKLSGSLYLNQLMGKISFGLYLNPSDMKLRSYIKYLAGLYKELY